MDEFFKASLMLDQWDHLSHAECEEIVRDLGKELPGAFRFHKVGRCALADQQHHIAFFEWDGPPEGYDHVFFALIPGGEATLGYDRDHPFVPNQQQQESWVDETQRTGMFNETLDVFLDLVMTPSISIPLLRSQKSAGWDLHLQQNAFGLFIARQPYHWEFCAERGIMRGGDGGTALHAGAGTFAEWLTLASAFYRIWDHEECYGVYLRRAFSLS